MTAPPTDLARWSLHCFCLRARSNPKRVIAMDDNGQVLYHLIGGGNVDDLRTRGLSVSESQLALLEAYGLIVQDGSGHRANLPVLGPPQIESVRETAKRAARTVITDVVTHAAEVQGELMDRGLGVSTYAVIFGHALDGVIWDVLRSRGLIPETDLTIDEPFWRGTFWAVFPGRERSAGTNELIADNAALVMVWDEGTVEGLRELAADPEVVSVLRSVRPKTRSVVIGGLPIPVLGPADPIQRACLVMAQTVAAAVPGGAAARDQFADLGVEATSEDATVIMTHEVIWEVAALLEDASVVERARDGDVASRLFVTTDSP
jgi:hypothetical protein